MKAWYADPRMMGRHFVLYSASDPTVKRHYTICSAMQPDLHVQLLNMANSYLNNNQTVEGDLNALNTTDSSRINLTMKNYKTARGLATRVHKTSIDDEEILKTGRRMETTDDLVSAD